jgi:thymidylate kinase
MTSARRPWLGDQPYERLDSRAVTTLAERIDELLEARVLVFGSPPPAGRDLDLLARPAEEAALRAWLVDQGFLERGGEWARFRSCAAESLDLVALAAWGLPENAAAELFGEAVPLEGFRHLARPAPRHLLLALARNIVARDGRLSPKQRAKIERALAEDPSAWRGARAAAPAWSAARSLAALEHAYGSGGHISRTGRAAALAEWPYAQGRTRGKARARAWLEAGRKDRERAYLVTFSGLDGAGKSSQAEALRSTLEQLGWQVTMQWVRLEWTTLWENRWLGILGWPARTALELLARARRSPERAAVAPALTPTEVRQRSGLVANVWVGVVALAHGSAQRGETRPHLRPRTVVICDRYTLDAAAHIRFRYGESRGYRFQIGLMRRLSPQPLRAYFVDVPAETAHARKAEQYSLDDLRRQERLYREEAPRLGVRRLDGERPREELCSEIAEDVWRALR